jgi:hypothetical protein
MSDRIKKIPQAEEVFVHCPVASEKEIPGIAFIERIKGKIQDKEHADKEGR